MTPLRILPWVLLACLWVFGVATYGADLPADLPQSINLGGDVTATMPSSLGRWLLIPLVATGSLGFILGLTLALPKYPQLFNFPEKERFLRLPARYRGPVLRAMQTTLDATATTMMLMLGTTYFAFWRVARGHDLGASHLAIVLGAVAFAPVVLILVARVNAATEEAERRWKDAGSPAE